MGDQFAAPELVIALSSAVGTDTTSIISELASQLKDFNYNTVVIKISQEALEPLLTEKDKKTSYAKAMGLMDAGNTVRIESNNKAILTCAAVDKIQGIRKNKTSGKEFLPQLPSTAFIIASLKHPEEVAKFREIYPNNFFLFAINESKESRLNNLNKRNIGNDDAQNLIERDADEKDEYGQHTRDVFEMADFHLTLNCKKVDRKGKNAIEKEKQQIIKRQITRILDLIFGNPFITPTFDEYAMFLAYSSGLRSADLGRQVGAVISNKNNEIISTGANEVPRFGGGQYWPNAITYDDEPNGRDYTRGYDANKREHQRLIEDIVASYTYKDDEERNAFRERLINSQIKYLTEYGRAVHAEMAAIVACARTGIALNGATLYCTTFPCHNCAKHIINAGIERVVYVEPYPKSKTFELYDDSTSMAEKDDKVYFEEFVGIGPRRFFDLFSLRLSNGNSISRKDKSGKAVQWKRSNARLRFQMLPISYIEKESVECLKWRTWRNETQIGGQ